MAAVRIENDAWTDPRYAVLADLCELPDARFALVLCASVWSYCTDRNEDVLSETLVDALTKHKGFARKMIDAQLADETKRGIRIKGARGRIEWLASKRNNASKGGKAKAGKRLASASDSLSSSQAGSQPSASDEPSSRSAAILPSAPALLCSAPTQAKREETEAIASGEARAPRSTKQPRITSWRRFPADYEPGETERALAAELRVDVAHELAAIRDHEFAKPKSDPSATFRTWLRNAAKFAPAARNGKQRGPAPVSSNAEFEEMIREQGGGHA